MVAGCPGGWEEWMLSDDLLVRESLGRYDAVEYDRQIAEEVQHNGKPGKRLAMSGSRPKQKLGAWTVYARSWP